MDDNYEYEPIFRSGRWMIQVTDDDGNVDVMTCGNVDEAGVWEKIKYLRMDDDRIDNQRGSARKYQ